MISPFTTVNTARMAREQRAERLHNWGLNALRLAGVILALTIAANVVRAAAITGANLPHTLEQAERLRGG
jgi:hypothetical protein